MAKTFAIHIVDDEDSIRRSLGFLLRNAGHTVHSWPDGLAFLRASDRIEPGCVLLDIHMPGMDGLSVQAELNARRINLPVILLTGHGDIPGAVRAMKAGAVDFLEKPFDREKLLAAIDMAFAWLEDSSVRNQAQKTALNALSALSEREREVLEGLACGYPNKTIAFDLGISARTVEVHRANLMVKLGVSNFADALRVAFAAGMGDEARWRAAHLGARRQNGTEESRL